MHWAVLAALTLATHQAAPGPADLVRSVTATLDAGRGDSLRAVLEARARRAPGDPAVQLALATVDRHDADAAATTISSLLDGLVAEGRLARDGDALRDPARSSDRPAALVEAMDRLEAALSVPAPPPLAEAATAAGCPAEGIRALQADGRLVRIGTDLAWATPTYRRLAAMALDLARVAPLTPAALRDATDTSRK